MDTGIVLGLISLIGSLAVGYWGYIRDKKKADLDMVNNLLQKALDLNKQELQNIRDVNKDIKDQLEFEIKMRTELQSEVREQEEEIRKLTKECDILEAENKDLRKRLECCEKSLNCPENEQQNSIKLMPKSNE